MISLCMIVKNEEKTLKECLQRIFPFVDEVIIVDTGSSDNTCEIAKQFDAKVFKHQFRGDFSEVRNISLEQASGEWILVLDADEWVDENDVEKLRYLTENNDHLAYLIWRYEYYPNGGWSSSTLIRFFRNMPEIRFHKTVHETVSKSLLKQKAKIGLSNIHLHHYGYQNRPVGKYVSQLKRQIELMPQQDSLSYSFLALEELIAGKYEEAITRCKTAISMDGHWKSYTFLLLGIAYFAQQKYEEAILQYLKAIEIADNNKVAPPVFASPHSMLGKVFFLCGDYEQAISEFHKVMKINPKLAQSYINLGILDEHQGKYDSAIKWYQESVEGNPLLNSQFIYHPEEAERYNPLTEIIPGFLGVHYHLGRCYMKINQRTKARQILKKALELNPLRPGIKELLQELESP